MLLSRPLPTHEPSTIVAPPLARGDREAWLALITEAFGADRGSESGLAAFWSRFPGPRETFAVVEQGAAVATVSIRRIPATADGYIHLLAVRRSHRRRGLGLALMIRALHALAERGATHAYVGTRHDEAQRLHRRAGFVPLGEGA